MDATQQQTITAPAFETALRAKAKEIITTLGELEVQANPITFDIDGIPCELSWADNDARLTINQAYSLRVPVVWLTAGPPT